METLRQSVAKVEELIFAQCLEHDLGAHEIDGWMGEQHIVDEPLKTVKIGDARLEEIIEIAGHGMGLENGERLLHEIGKALGIALGMGVELHMHECGERKAEGVRVELGAISPDEPRSFERLTPARRLRF